MRPWNRGRRTLRNFLLALLLAALVYASQGFPPYTVGGMCRQVSHDYLLGELEPLYVQRDRVRLGRNRSKRYTRVAARSGNTYVIFRYEDGLLGSHLDGWREPNPAIEEGAVCRAWGGTIYAAGPFEEAATATATVRVQKTLESTGRVVGREFVLEGERLADQVFAFPYEMGGHFPEDEGRAYGDMTLPELVDLWYRRPAPNGDSGVYYSQNAELPCVVTLYGASGEVLETLERTVTANGIRSWW